jgi:hypothetical protein
MNWNQIWFDTAVPDFPTAVIDRHGDMSILTEYTLPNINRKASDLLVLNENPWTDNPIDGIWHNSQSNVIPLYPPVIARNKDGHLEIFAFDIESNNIRHIWQDANDVWNNAIGANAWPWLGSNTLPTGEFIAPMQVGTNSDGRLQVFACLYNIPLANSILLGQPVGPPSSRDLWSIAQNNDDWNDNGWGEWTNLGHPPSGDFGGYVVGSDSANRQTIFAIGRDGELWSLQQVKPTGSWGKWLSVGNYSSSLKGSPAVTLQGNRRFVFAEGFDGNIFYISEKLITIQSFMFWGDWISLPSPGAPASVFGAGVSINGKVCVFVQTADDFLVLTVNEAGNTAADWVSIGDGLVKLWHFHNPIVSKNQAGQLQIYCAGDEDNRGTTNPVVTPGAIWNRGEDATGNWV